MNRSYPNAAIMGVAALAPYVQGTKKGFPARDFHRKRKSRLLMAKRSRRVNRKGGR